MGQRVGRVTCPQCGASNFDTVATCYRCRTALGQGSGSAPSVSQGAMQSSQAPYQPAYQPSALPPINGSMQNGMQGASMGAVNYPPPAFTPPQPEGDPKMARRAAILLALTIPFLGLPIGWAFMMMEDNKRRQQVGRLCATWSLIALFFHLLLSFVAMQAISGYLPLALKLTQQMIPRDGQGGGGVGQP